MYQVVTMCVDLAGKAFELARTPYADGEEARSEALRSTETVKETCGILDWRVLLTENGSLIEEWSMDDAQSPYEHGILIRDNFDAMFFLARNRHP